jgi:D-lactate dehydrogenase
MISWFGTDRLPLFFALEGAMDARLDELPVLPRNMADRAMQFFSRLVPEALPRLLLGCRGKKSEHHLILKVPGHVAGDTEKILNEPLVRMAGFCATRRRPRKQCCTVSR